ncbi:hypothetical protein AERO_01430 [Aeromicrobium fastidiosum]|uniref:hypothetical protein n=1 Tax=Aeromicrobium fastidiosum TaxID=52699 RepID=UPI00202353A7|nr:hypothetical protein [Aeromicrobium fastidiosum]MCL8250031.1 hypothetical protein [Aeromicrobium fastidiosum]
MTQRAERDDFSYLWLGSWKLHASVVAFFTISLIKPLTSSAPLVAVYFPGAFIAASGWWIVRHVKQWSPIRHPIRTNVPVALYLLLATAALFAAHSVSGRDIYRTAALGSLWLTVPTVVLTAFVVMLRRRIREHDDLDRQG